MATEGKIILKYDRLGFIEYDLDKRISYEVLEFPEFEIGDNLTFEIVEKQVKGTEKTYERAIKLKSKEVLGKPSKPIQNNLYVSRGDVIETNILEFVQPSLIVLDFYNRQKALLPIHNLAWNLVEAHNQFNHLKVNQRIKVVYLGRDTANYPLVSVKELTPSPSENEIWQKVKPGSFLKGVVIEKLAKSYVLDFKGSNYGLVESEFKPNINVGDQIKVQVVSKSADNFLLNTTLDFEKSTSDERKVEGSGLLPEKPNFLPPDKHLASKDDFFESLYFTFCEESEFNDEKKFLEDAFAKNPHLFDLSFSVNLTLFLQFTFKTWESDFINNLLPYLKSKDPAVDGVQAGINYLSNQRYWISIYSPRPDFNLFTLFNEEIYISGFVTEEADERFFLIQNLTIGRKNKNSSYYKEKSQKNGSFLYASKIQFLKHGSNRPIGKDYFEIFDLLYDKSEAFSLFSDLKRRNGGVLTEQGVSLKIFSNFLFYQEFLAKKKSQARAKLVKGPFSRISLKSEDLAIKTEITQELLEINEKSDTDKVFVSIKTEEVSTKASKNGVELVWFSDADFEIIDRKAIFTFRDLDLDLNRIRDGFYVEPKVSLKQWKVQNEIILDFLNKKIDISHFESVLVKPEKIKPPRKLDLNFFDPLLEQTKLNLPENNQSRAVNNAVGNRNVFLIQGPPGTGKTTVISEIVQQLLEKNEKILVTSQTHVAVDNVLKKLVKLEDKTLVRFGNLKRVMPELELFHIDNRIDSLSKQYENITAVNLKLLEIQIEKNSLDPSIISREITKKLKELSSTYPENFRNSMFELNKEFVSTISNFELDKLKELKQILLGYKDEVAGNFEDITSRLIYSSLDVAFATCIGVKTDRGINDNNIQFDTVIIDEAGKANLSESIAAVSMGKKVILVGDHKQLPPYMDEGLIDENDPDSFTNNLKFNRNKYSLDQIRHALSTSLFEFIVNKNDIGEFPDSNVVLLNFQHRMHPNIGQFISDSFYGQKVKMGSSTKNNRLKLSIPLDKEIVFFDTSSSKNPFEENYNNSYINKIEAKCISEIVVPTLIEEGVSISDFAVISPYRSQVSCISNELIRLNYSGVDVSTLDSFQGMEYDVIIFSFTRSSKRGKVGFLDDASRLNVAFSRAKKKLILVGNSKTLTQYSSHYDKIYPYTELFKKIVSLSKDEKKGRFVNVTNYVKSKEKSQAIEKLKEGQEIKGKYVKSIEIPIGVLHIFLLINDVQGAILDKKCVEKYQPGQEEQLKITRIDKENDRINLKSVKEIMSQEKVILKFFMERKVGDTIECTFSRSVEGLGHFFKISRGFDGLVYDPDLKRKNFKKDGQTSLEITSLDKLRKRVSLKLI